MRNNGGEAFPGKGKLRASDEEVRDLQRELNRVRMGALRAPRHPEKSYS